MQASPVVAPAVKVTVLPDSKSGSRARSIDLPRVVAPDLGLLRRRVIESGEFYLVAANIDGKDALRVTVMNPFTTAEHLDQLLDTLRRFGKELLGAGEFESLENRQTDAIPLFSTRHAIHLAEHQSGNRMVVGPLIRVVDGPVKQVSVFLLTREHEIDSLVNLLPVDSIVWDMSARQKS